MADFLDLLFGFLSIKVQLALIGVAAAIVALIVITAYSVT